MTVVFSTIAFALFHARFVNYGFTFFVMMPIVIGFLLGQRPRWRRVSYLGLLVGIVAFMYLLLSAQLEGWFCVITLLPLIIVVMMIGVWIGYAVRKYLDKRNDPNKTLKLSVAPLLILLFSGVVEHFFTERYEHGRVESTLVLPYTPMQVYNAIKSVDTLDTQKPFLLHLGLSTPQKCVLEKEAVGAARICYFADGVIEERVTELRPGEILRMDV
ncbi:MAG: polyketide cyclase, partial [Sphingobacteriales bacterium]